MEFLPYPYRNLQRFSFLVNRSTIGLKCNRLNKTTLFILIPTLLFCILAAFDITPYLRGPAPYPPDWRWDYQFINTLSKVWAPLICSVIIFLLYRKGEKNIWKFVFLFFIFQLSVLYFQRAGIGVLMHRIIDPGLNGYFSTGVGIQNLQKFLTNYNKNVLSFYQHAKGHPPFAVLFFYLIEQFFGLFPKLSVPLTSFSNLDINVIWNNLNNASKLTALLTSLFVPLLASITIVPLYKLANILYGKKAALISILLYIGVPAVTLFTPLNDVFLPFFTVWSLYFLVRGVEQNSKCKLFFSGLIFSAGLYFSLTFLPLLLVFAVLFFAWKKQKMALGMEFSFLLGALLIPAILFLFFGLNSLEMFQTLMKGLPIQRSYTTWIFYNIYDFFIFCSIPIAVLFLSNLKRSFAKIDILFWSFFAMLLLLDLSGSVRGEVGRIWLPFVPLMVLPAAKFLSEKKPNSKQIALIFFLSILQLLVMQEFWVTLY